jgi:hypothetical protein
LEKHLINWVKFIDTPTSSRMSLIQVGAKFRTHWPSQAARFYQRGRRPFGKLKVKKKDDGCLLGCSAAS